MPEEMMIDLDKERSLNIDEEGRLTIDRQKDTESLGREAAEVFRKAEEIPVTETDETIWMLTKEINELRKAQTDHERGVEDAKSVRLMKEESLYKLLENMGVKSIKTDFGTFTRGLSFKAYYHQDDRERVAEWLKDIGCGALVKSTVHANTFTAFIKERMEANNSAGLKNMDGIPDFVLSFTKNKISFRKS